MHPATNFGLRFAYAAAAVVAIGTFLVEITTYPVDDPFGPPLFGLATGVLAIGTFLWSLLVVTGIAWNLNGISDVPAVYAFASGVAFALLTPVLGHLLRAQSLLMFIVIMLVWVVLFPTLATLSLWWISRPNTSLERTRGE